MDIRRTTPHFNLSSNRTSPSGGAVSMPQVQPVSVQPAHNVQQKLSNPEPPTSQPTQENSSVEKVEDFAFEPSPPPIPKVEKVYQNQTDKVVQQEAKQPTIVQPSSVVGQVAGDSVSDALKPAHTVKPGKHIHIKYVAVGAVAFALLFAVSVVWQQIAISDLKNDRKVLGEKVNQVNPIRAGSVPE